MPAHAKYASPAVQLRIVLATARREGRTFDEAWEAALGEFGRTRGQVRFPHYTRDRRAWRIALEATREEWRAAFELRPSALSEALDAAFEAIFDSSQPAEPVGPTEPRGLAPSAPARLGRAVFATGVAVKGSSSDKDAPRLAPARSVIQPRAA